MRRPLSGRKNFANAIVEAERNEATQRIKDGVDLNERKELTTLHVVKDGVSVCMC
jgi:hypothetical protein